MCVQAAMLAVMSWQRCCGAERGAFTCLGECGQGGGVLMFFQCDMGDLCLLYYRSLRVLFFSLESAAFQGL